MSAQCPEGRRRRGQSPLPEPGLAPSAAPDSATFWGRQSAVEAGAWGAELHTVSQTSRGLRGSAREARFPFCASPVLGGMPAFFLNIQF